MAPFAFAIFTGAFLLFQVQPLMAKYLLPWFGGGTGVWTTCLLFFQVLLLCGYGYAHVSTRLLKPRGQAGLHLALVALALATLPVIPADAWRPTAATNPTWQLLVLLTVSVGLPYFVLAATAPLLQHWFSRAHPGPSPFRLYALSNAGSLLALLSYPVFFETWFRRTTQAYLWSAGVIMYALACVFCAAKVWALSPAPLHTRPERSLPRCAVKNRTAKFKEQLLWLLLPACASVLLLAVTNRICQELTVVPLLWVLPLAVYLLSFIICFERPQWYARAWFGPALVAALLMLGWVVTHPASCSTPLQILLYCAGLLVCCLVCHGEVYRLKPEPERLTWFYLALAAGGALGGLFVAVLAPVIFSDYLELQCGLLLAGGLFLAVCAATAWRAQQRWWRGGWAGGWVLLAGLGWMLWSKPQSNAQMRACRVRNFYGVLSVYRHEFPDAAEDFVELVHGRVAHGMQFVSPGRAHFPTLYYTPRSGIGRVFQALEPGSRRICVVGLGAGTLAAYGRPGDCFRFYEINPQVETLARTYFTYLKDSPAETAVVLGDARLSLEREPAQNFDLLALDAFNGDAIPMHLLTREAFLVYQRQLKPGGLIAVHISNACLNLEPVLSRLAGSLGYTALVLEQIERDEPRGILPSTWMVFGQNAAVAQRPSLAEVARLPAAAPAASPPLWTDDYSALFSVLRWRQVRGEAQPEGRPTAEPARALTRQKALAAAIAGYREAVSREPESTVALNNLACLLATGPDPALRNGLEAVEYAQRACRLTGYTNAATLTTLAAAYAEAGRFDDAVGTAQSACQLAGAKPDPALLEQNLRLLDLYRRKQAFHQGQP